MARKKKVAKRAPKKEVVDAVDKVKKLDEKEALLFGKLDAEMRNNLQAIELNRYKLDALTRDFQEKKATIIHLQDKHREEINRIKPEYDSMLQSFSKKYGIPPQAMVIDPDTGTVRDASKDV